MIPIEPHIQGLIFDCDGTLADTMPAHYLAWRDTVAAHGGQFSETLFYQTGGMPSTKIVELLNERFGYELNPQQIADEKEQLFFDRYLAQTQPIEPIVAVARHYRGQLPMAVATGGYRKVATRILKTIAVWDWFDALVPVEDVAHGKPAPGTFLEAAHRIGIDPTLCHAFEDSDLGIESARRAGMTVTDVREVLHPLNGRNGS